MRDKSLNDLRKKIDLVDKQLLNTLSKRVELVWEIGKLKKDLNLKPLDKKRWEEVLETRLALAKKLNLSEEFVEKLYNLIHEYSLEIERDKNL